MRAAGPHTDPGDGGPSLAGLTHVATVSFLASRALPAGGFFVALAGGVALARAAWQRGPRAGYAASVATVLDTVATMGPARFNVPFTQALTAPLLGWLGARGVGAPAQIALCAVLRLLHNAVVSALVVVVVLGGLDAFVAAYDTLLGWALPAGRTGALAAVAAGLVAWSLFASTVQVLVYGRALRAWPAAGDQGPRVAEAEAVPPARSSASGLDPRGVTVAAVLALVALLASTRWVVLGMVVGWLLLVVLTARIDTAPLPVGVALAAVLGLGALAVGLLGGTGLDASLRRSLRAAMLVLVATWLRAAAGDAGLREVFRRALGRLRRIPAVGEAALVLDGLGSQRRLARAARGLGVRLRAVRRRPRPLLAAALGWVAEESRRPPAEPEVRPALTFRPRDGLLVASAALLFAGLAL